MSVHDQCPSTTGKGGKPAKAGKSELARRTRELPTLVGAAGSPKMWQSLDDCADAPEFRDWLEREFPAGASELEAAELNDAASGRGGADSRRDFLKLMGASIALAGAATIPGCRRPDHNILAYSKAVPEDVIPGKPLFYATSMPLPGGGAEGLLVETHENRPTKIEGNPLHPLNRGKSGLWAQAGILSMYDPDRQKSQPIYHNPAKGLLNATWDDFAHRHSEDFGRFDATKGRGLAFIVDKKTGPSRDAAKEAILKRWPEAMWVAYNAVENEAAINGTRIALGAPMRELYDFEKARVIVSLDRDFLCGSGEHEAGALANARGFAATRRVLTVNPEMSRLYVVEPGWSLAGSSADHRMRVAPSQIPAVAAALAKAVLAGLGGGKAGSLAGAVEGASVPATADAGGVSASKWIEEAASDLVKAGAGAVVLAGASQPAEVHALVHALNAALGSGVVSYLLMGKDEATPTSVAIGALAAAMDSGQVDTLVVVEANPVYNAPAELDFAAKFAKVRNRVYFGVDGNETSAASVWSLNGAHFLESWGDTEAHDGTLAPMQPMIAPLYEGLSEIEFLSLLAAGPTADDAGVWKRPDGFVLVQDLWKKKLGGDFEKLWRRALHDGIFAVKATEPKRASADFGAVATAWSGMKAAAAPGEKLDVVFTTGQLHDGRFANLGWLQELPQVGTRVVWDNPALLSPKTAEKLGISPYGYTEKDPNTVYTKGRFPYGQKVKVTVGGRTLEMAAWIMPGMADDTVILPLGYGRTACGLVGNGVGFNTFMLRSSGARTVAGGGSVVQAGGDYLISSTQTHWALEDRTSILRQIDVGAWNKHAEGKWASTDPLYGTQKDLNLAEKLGELAHSSPNISIYENPLNKSKTGPAAGSAFSVRPQWGMTIDLSTCTGCGVCTVACQSENNIPVVGKKETAKGREMTWIRVDRYFTGEDVNNPDAMMHQPVACVQCENAPCETVCPVNATTHGPEGINYMVYNRCIGTRYCANNCPYKVRRFNFFDYGVTKFNGQYYGQEMMPDGGPANKNLIPPRLREKLDQIVRLQKNPDVTVRSRGVMEKCTYCIQRINAARIECKLNDIRGGAGENIVPDGFLQTACQQACPSESIVFGDLLDPESRVHKTRHHARSYLLLGFLNTRPRTSHMVAVRNPNTNLRATVDPLSESEGGHAPPGGGGGEHAFFDRKKSAADRGYAMSLRVVTPVGAGASA